ncbi:MAG: hypothetical protein A2381_06745 [Bdellovibrionales bacterium RIFOXYB1_FULL_37_110]|nr:MAG: hypothetical protein A2417_14620 [Bdellovibrionales bacterium RIFOXYC1_FULL_37_79]OFZ57761.1 MAG: hypothetical protein A2381_06745 [Bdellovibrionales bacterium RIFOXYB1_FULL_37_110]OFZ62727.1 MAG: hypothetical protein A2577_16265 [Bdellovibrionales bacterium RIFOXYD1_FULL_36_51]
MFTRKIEINSIFSKNPDFSAFFILGPRQTGKSFLIKHSALEKIWYINLLATDIFQEFTLRPYKLREHFRAMKNDIDLIIIDEIQKVPTLLDEVHLLLEEESVKFILTGSSARKLKKQSVNLLGGRALQMIFHPLTYPEIISDSEFDLARILSFGTLPKIYNAKTPEKMLKSYCSTYLKEEIANESLTRNLPSFARFLEVAANCNGEILNYSKIANDAQVPKTTVIEYFSILEDTLIAKKIPPFLYTQKRKPLETPKFYFFDVGVVRRLAGFSIGLDPSLNNAGKEFETYIYHELATYIDYQALNCEIRYWRTASQHLEVDFIIDTKVAIEVKLSKHIQENDLKGLKALKEEKIVDRTIVVSRESQKRIVDGIEIYPCNEFLKELWDSEIIN